MKSAYFASSTVNIQSLMLRKLLTVLSLAVLLFSCDTKEKEAMQQQIDSLSTALEESHEMSQTLTEVGTLMDSIDASRQLLRVNMVEGTTYDDYAARMKDLNSYIKETEDKIDDLEKSLKTSKANSAAFSRTIKKLKADLESKSQEVSLLQEQVEKYRNENQNLVTTVELQDAEISDKQSQIEAKNQELAFIEARVQELMIQSKVSEGDAYYMRAVAVEEAANRTKLAPRKKKETLKEALELYRKALSLGKGEAQAKIDELEKRL
jgi:chromosome segregation ATPase